MEQENFMKEALKEAKKAYEKEEIPIGAVIVKDGKVIARGHNLKETQRNTLKHAELVAIEKASKKLNCWRLQDCDLYVTLEPCPMCMGAILNARIRTLYFGTDDPKSGACGSIVDLTNYPFNHKLEVEKGIMQKECAQILTTFFKELRKKKKQN